MTRCWRSWGVLILAAAFVLRGGWVLYQWQSAGATLAYPDEELHWQLGRNLVCEGTLVSDDGRFAARMPVYPMFLACFAWMGSSGVLLARLAQAAIGAIAAWIAYRLGRDAIGPWAGRVAGGLVCLDPFQVFFANLLLTEVLFTCIALAFVAAMWYLLLDPTRRRISLAALAIFGPLAIMTRPSAAAWIPAAWGLVLLFAPNRGRMLVRLLVCPVTLVVFMMPWALRNQAVLGDPAFLSANGGLTLYDAQGPQADGSSDQAFLQDMPELAGLGEVERDRVLQRRAIEQMAENPGRVVRLAGMKFLRMWSLTPNVAEHRVGATAIASAIYTLVVLLLAGGGLMRVWAMRPGTRRFAAGVLLGLVWLPVLYFTIVHCVYIGSVRYRVPLMPMLAIAGAATFTVAGGAAPGTRSAPCQTESTCRVARSRPERP